MLRCYLNIGAIAVFLLLLLPAPLLSSRPDGEERCATGQEVVRARWLMGTVLELRVPASSPNPDALAEAAFREVSAVEAAASLWRADSELSRVHERAAAGEAVVVSETLGALVQVAVRAASLTQGAYSPAVGALVEAYDLRGPGRWPSDDELRRARSLSAPDGVRYEPESRTLRLEPGVTLDLDGIAKGFALDRAAVALRARGVDDALLNFGGQLLAVGPPPGCPARQALVASPSEAGVPVFSVPLRDASLSTTANSERARSVDGRSAGHLLDPRTGLLVPFAGSVSVLAIDGATADALSTAWAVEGPALFRRSRPGSPVRQWGKVAFVLPGRLGGPEEALFDSPFGRLRPPARLVEAPGARARTR